MPLCSVAKYSNPRQRFSLMFNFFSTAEHTFSPSRITTFGLTSAISASRFLKQHWNLPRLKPQDSRTCKQVLEEDSGFTAAGEPLQIYPRKQTANLSGIAWFTVLHDSLPFYGLSFQRWQKPKGSGSLTRNRRSGFCLLCGWRVTGKSLSACYVCKRLPANIGVFRCLPETFCSLLETEAGWVWDAGCFHFVYQFILHFYKIIKQFDAFISVWFL